MADIFCKAYSMTGYGKGEARMGGVRCAIEIRSTNHRYRDVSIKLPRAVACYEDRLRQLAHARISRGKVDVFVNYEDEAAQVGKVRVNAQLATAVVEAARKLSEELGIVNDVATSDLLRLPDVFVFEAAGGVDEQAAGGMPNDTDMHSHADCVWASFREAMEAALEAHSQMRGAEGGKLAEDMLEKLKSLESLLKAVELRAPLIPAEQKAKLEERIAELLGAMAAFTENEAARVAMEAAIIADRCCVDEEIVRLRSHLAQAGKTLISGEPMGRKLDFLLQEINREINTIGSKTNDAEIGARVVEMKSEAEKLREQAQNLE